jgi:hypothetical protein
MERVPDGLEKTMCEYFVDFHKRLQDMEKEMSHRFSDFYDQIKTLTTDPSGLPLTDQQKKYIKYQDIMIEMATHYGEGDWLENTLTGSNFGEHYLGLCAGNDCEYCYDTKNHKNGLHLNDVDDFCVHCRAAEMN